MRLAQFFVQGETETRCGEVRDGSIVSFEGITDLISLLDSPELPEANGEEFDLAECTLVAPHRPGGIFCAGLTYREHPLQDSATRSANPVIFLKPSAAVIGPYDPITPPDVIDELDYEGELAVVIGVDGAIAGYMVANDLTARDLQRTERQWSRAKGFDGSCPIGPWITTVDEIENPHALGLRTWVNGELRQDGTTADMMYGIDELLAYIQETCTLRPGDLVLTGSPAGTGISFDPPIFLHAGDTVRIEIEHLGVIENIIQ